MPDVYHIVSEIGLKRNGTRDYALRLAKGLKKKYQLNSCFLSFSPRPEEIDNLAGFNVISLNKSDSKSLLNFFAEIVQTGDRVTPIIVHYSNYGYAKRGCPFWLAISLKKAKTALPNLRIITVFHEFYARGGIFQSAFWLKGFQAGIAAKIISLSDEIVTTSQAYFRILKKISKCPWREINVLPVYSNIKEPPKPPTLIGRANHILIFGKSVEKLRKNNFLVVKVNQLCRLLKISKIIVVSDSAKENGFPFLTVPVETKDFADSDELSQLLLTVRFGLLFYSLDNLDKSGVFAAYAAHRSVAIVIDKKKVSDNGLSEKRCLTFSEILKNNKELDLQAIADEAYRWYLGHSFQIQIEIFFKFLRTPIWVKKVDSHIVV
ncbi:MAG: hypothetical protein PHV17_06950 [Candidatus Omnitrophica bacterium]|nr:hypothetical protein [Candidatus Omnitrophota bacterium]